jgi:hypothetical protein
VARSRAHSLGTSWTAVLLATAVATGAAAQQSGDVSVSRPDRWFVASAPDQVTNEPTPRMLYLGRDGTVLIVQCAAREGRKTGGWSFMVRRDEWSFPQEFVEGWWAVDSEPLNGPLRWGGAGPLVLLNEDALKERLQEPVDSRIHLRVASRSRQWNVELGVRDLAPAVERFAPACRVA